MYLPDGQMWPMPITLDAPSGVAERLEAGGYLGLNDQEGFDARGSVRRGQMEARREA